MSSRDAALQGGAGRGLRPAGPVTHDTSQEEEEHSHPSDGQYIRIAIILTIITVIEVAIYYVEGVRDILVPALIILSVSKFIAVVGYFMHLKFDDRRFTVLFVAGMVLSVGVITALVLMMLTANFFPDLPAGPGSGGASH
jgi:cytochrome c oxidase subunit IV